MRIIIAGGGIVGLTTGIAFKALGWDVLVCEQAAEIRAAGAAIGMWSNALDVFSELGLGEGIRNISTRIETWFYDATGCRLRAPGYDLADHTVQLMPRAPLNALLARAVGMENIRLSSKVTGFEEAPGHVDVLFDDGRTERADLLIGADGVFSHVRNQLVPGHMAREHVGHLVYRGIQPAGDAPAEGTLLTIGHNGVSGGWSRIAGDLVVWMVNQYPSPEPEGSKKEEALKRAASLNDGGWHERLVRFIDATPEDAILRNRIMFVPALPNWTSGRVALIGDAAHGLSPHIGAGGTLGVEDVYVLVNAVKRHADLHVALLDYESRRIPQYARVRELSDSLKQARDAHEWAERHAAFTHWMLNDDYWTARS